MQRPEFRLAIQQARRHSRESVKVNPFPNRKLIG
jgi:hypothetical protein